MYLEIESCDTAKATVIKILKKICGLKSLYDTYSNSDDLELQQSIFDA